MSLAQRVRDMRYVKGWGPDELANRAEISRTALYQIENGKTGLPRAATLRRIAVALEVPMENLLVGLEHEAEPAASESQRPRLGQPRDTYQWTPAEGGPLSLPNQSGARKRCASVEESRIALNAELPVKKNSNDWIFVREGELMSKLHDLLHSPIGRGVAEILEELHGAALLVASAGLTHDRDCRLCISPRPCRSLSAPAEKTAQGDRLIRWASLRSTHPTPLKS